jgi:hypothetical protein
MNVVMKKWYLVAIIILLTLFAFWGVVSGDLRDFRYSRNLLCDQISDTRESEICRSIERNQNYEFFGHAIISFGYQVSFDGARRAWCELNIQGTDEALLKRMSYKNYVDSHSNSDMRLSDGATILSHLLDAQLHPNPDLYPVNSIYSPQSPDYLLKVPCG